MDLVERLRAQTVIKRAALMTIDMLDGRGPIESKGGETVQLRNPDGPEAADEITALRAEVESLRAENEELISDVGRQMSIANIECNRAEGYVVALRRIADTTTLSEARNIARSALSNGEG